MNCSEARELLSAYYDGELLAETGEGVAEHVEGCPGCAAQLGRFQKLTALAQGLTNPHPPALHWTRIERELDADADVRLARTPGPTLRTVAKFASLAAILLIAVAIGTVSLRFWPGTGGHERATLDVAGYLDAFQNRPHEAQRLLVAKYGGRLVDIEQARHELGYRPVVADGLPDRYAVNSAYLLEMPGCACVQCLCQRDDGGTLAVFEHDEKHPVSFGNRPAITTRCNGRSCRVVRIGDRLAVTWKANRRQITVVGARDLDEIRELMDWMEKNQPLPRS